MKELLRRFWHRFSGAELRELQTQHEAALKLIDWYQLYRQQHSGSYASSTAEDFLANCQKQIQEEKNQFKLNISEIEDQVLATIINSPQAFRAVIHILRPEYFSTKDKSFYYTIIKELFMIYGRCNKREIEDAIVKYRHYQGNPADSLRKQDLVYLEKLSSYERNVPNIIELAKKIRELGQQRLQQLDQISNGWEQSFQEIRNKAIRKEAKETFERTPMPTFPTGKPS